MITESFIGYDKRIINPPNIKMTIEERAYQMWCVHPCDLDKMEFGTRISFYEAHLKAAIEQEKNESEKGASINADGMDKKKGI